MTFPAMDRKGYLMIGAQDNGKLNGLKVVEWLLLKIANIRTDGNILPQPLITVENSLLRQVIYLLPKYNLLNFLRFVTGDVFGFELALERVLLQKQKKKYWTERRLSNVRTFDAKPCLGTSLQDLDISLIKKEFLSKAVAEDILTDDKRSIEEQLASLGFFDLRYNCPTIGAIILFGNNPERYVHGSYIQYVRFKGKDRSGDIIHEFKFDGNLCKSLSQDRYLY